MRWYVRPFAVQCNFGGRRKFAPILVKDAKGVGRRHPGPYASEANGSNVYFSLAGRLARPEALLRAMVLLMAAASRDNFVAERAARRCRDLEAAV